MEEVLADILRVGTADDDRADDVEEEVAGLRARIGRVHETLKAARAPRPRVAVLDGVDPLSAAGGFVPDMVKRAGGVDVPSTVGALSPTLTAALMRAADPDIVIIAPHGATLADAVAAGRRLLALPEFRWLHDRQLWALDGGTITSRPGPQVVQGIEVMARIFNGALFTPLDDTHAERLA